jgi:hypothetical protein
LIQSIQRIAGGIGMIARYNCNAVGPVKLRSSLRVTSPRSSRFTSTTPHPWALYRRSCLSLVTVWPSRDPISEIRDIIVFDFLDGDPVNKTDFLGYCGNPTYSSPRIKPSVLLFDFQLPPITGRGEPPPLIVKSPNVPGGPGKTDTPAGGAAGLLSTCADVTLFLYNNSELNGVIKLCNKDAAGRQGCCILFLCIHCNCVDGRTWVIRLSARFTKMSCSELKEASKASPYTLKPTCPNKDEQGQYYYESVF